MAEVYSQAMKMRHGALSVFATTEDGGRIVVGSEPFAIILDPIDALALSTELNRAFRALREQWAADASAEQVPA